MARPPKRAQQWLDRWLPPAERVELIGDLDEEFAERAMGGSQWRASAWYWVQTLRLIRRRRHLQAPFAPARSVDRAAIWADFGGDLRYGWRSLRRAPIFSSVAILSLVVSLGLSTSVLSLARTVLLSPIDVPTASRIVRLGLDSPNERQQAVNVGAAAAPARMADVLLGAWQADTSTLEALATYDVQPKTVGLGTDTVRTDVAAVGAGFFTIFPARPEAGRLLDAADWAPASTNVALVSARLLATHDARVHTFVDRTIALDGVPFTIVGVLPIDAEWPSPTVDVWVVERWRPPSPDQARQMFRTPMVLGLMRPGVAITAVRQEGQAIAERLVNAGVRLSLISTGPPVVVVDRLEDELLRPARPALILLVAGTIGVLIAANVTLVGFLISRNVGRRRELAVREALGASAWRRVRPLVAEQVWIGAGGLLGGVALAAGAIRVLPVVAPHDLPRLAKVALDGPTLLFAILAAVASVLLVGLLPARRLTKSSPRESRMVVVQVALATVLVVGSLLVGRSLMAMVRLDLGYDPTGVLTFQLGTRELAQVPGQIVRTYDAILERTRQLPGVAWAGTSTALPLHGRTSGQYTLPTGPDAASQQPKYSTTEYLSQEYLQALGARLVAGRFFDDRDTRESQPVVIVNETYVRTFLPDVDPLGQTVARGVRRPVIVGVIAPIARSAATEAPVAAQYFPASQSIEIVTHSPSRTMGVAVRTTGDPGLLARSIRGIVAEVAPGVPLHNMMPLTERVARTYAQPRFFAIALVLFALLTLGTTVLGVYGTLAASVERRRVELGVRRALGATSTDLTRQVVGGALGRSAIGLVLGTVAAAVAATWGRSQLFGVAPLDVVSYLAAGPGILVIVWCGAWVPLRTALSVDPARTLRNE